MVRYTYPKSARLCRRSDFERLFRTGARSRHHCLSVCAAKGLESTTRVGLSVGRRCGNAVARNRIKRLLREAFRLERPSLPKGYDLVVIPTAEVRSLSLAFVRSYLRLAVERAVNRLDGRKAPDRGG